MASDYSLIQKPLSELIADEIKQWIWNKDLDYGERLLETDLAEKFDVSRSTIREALKILEGEELIISKARKGTYVATFTEKDLIEINELRTLLEARAFLQALPKLEDKHFDDLEAIIERMKQGVKRKDWNELFNLDMTFHRYLMDLSDNSRILKIYDSLQVQIRTALMHLDEYYSSFDAFYQEHKELLDILKTKDADKVKESIINHIGYVEEKLLGSI
ncbi:GntR family transcriptional regulator [Virgibacillus sp. MSJ-26]|uniref:GntR family transcriptional regulator n=1 Tax=Virgibacillus sp. MSJ-26 TaxID=2841522 RepID=UPI001C1111FB|nr:GntR family transcriptional regulator [Virgibacillus sp. MSJ-26]MBU5468728.1 GntR family transcriptional regulator [Virgibacillus sp. MSJ-26]